MLKKEDIQHQNISDMLRVAVILGGILEDKQLTPAENKRVVYCTKIIMNVSEKQKVINNFKQ